MNPEGVSALFLLLTSWLESQEIVLSHLNEAHKRMLQVHCDKSIGNKRQKGKCFEMGRKASM